MQKVGRYEIDRLIGEGAMAHVYRARDPSIGRMVAIKLLKPEFRQDLALAGRFVREAKAAGALSHPNIVTIYDVGEADGFAYIAMELLDGKPLDEQLRDHGRMAPSEVARLGAQLADALDYAHGLGVVHRDIKPGNIMLAQGGAAVKILDFGIARIAEGDRSGAERTQFGQVVGTPRYMSPEQAFGLELDHRSDLFSLGVVLYEMLTGSTAFSGTSLATLALQITQRNPEPLDRVLPGCPRGLRHIVDKLLAKQPDKRFGSGADVAQALRREQDAATEERGERRRLSLPIRLTLLTGLVVGLALIASIATLLDRQYRAMEHMALTAGGTITGFVANNVALRAVENSGLALAEQDWAPVQAFIEAASRDPGVRRIVMADSSGIVRAASDPAIIGRAYVPASGERALPGGTDVTLSATADGDFRFLQTIRYAGRPFGRIELVGDGSELAAAAAGSRNLLIGLGMALLIMVLAISYLIGRSVARPLERLRRALIDAEAGDVDVRISHNRRDEFGRLFDAFNALAERGAASPPGQVAPAPVSLDATRIGAPPLNEPMRRAS